MEKENYGEIGSLFRGMGSLLTARVLLFLLDVSVALSFSTCAHDLEVICQ